jgi:hypothetical protein
MGRRFHLEVGGPRLSDGEQLQVPGRVHPAQEKDELEYDHSGASNTLGSIDDDFRASQSGW